ncbi:hypothetical protein CFC21_063480 [Triticum aestivum]|uniref:Ubiquitin-like domain-containing protein n=2 Tax=Triticum aestivum TaxID=4565 RepID=A0A9R1GZD9_WHEAT|nr:hypothetical protein CFC21_063470 [Triticum aestivum]KAF7056021.1 hypothetical protein CFC21_063480 [Triticum aestivum]
MDSIKIKLAVDRSRNRVLFADAGSDFVDVLLSFLTLPLSAIQFCAATSPGCLFNLCDSVNRLTGGRLLKVEACHDMLLTPSTAHEFGGFWNSHDAFVKNQPNLQVDGDYCRCWQVMARLVHVYNKVSSGSVMFVRCKEQFMISDDLTIMPASTRTMQLLARNFGPGAILPDFEELEVCVGWTEVVVAMLKASLSSDTIFTDIFLPMGSGDQDALAPVKPSINKKVVVAPNEDSGPHAPLECKIKLFYDGQEKKVMYAECKHEFVDLLLGFLAYPLGCVIKNMRDNGVTSPLGNGGGFDNLYNSVVGLDAAGFITGGKSTETLLNPPLSPFSVRPKCATPKEHQEEPENYNGLVSYSWCAGCCLDLVEDRNYVVSDDLLMHQASGMSVTKHWCRRDKANVVEMEITIGKPEAVELLQAMLTSRTPLTDVFNNRLEEHSSLQKMQISVEFPAGKIITVEVSRFDTIATVKRRINDQVPIPAGLRHELFYGIKILEDSCTAAEYNLVSKCSITLEFRQLSTGLW